MKYKDKQGNTLYGFSQENLERTNRELRRTNKYMQFLLLMFILLLGLVVSFFVWLEMNDIFTKLIYGG